MTSPISQDEALFYLENAPSSEKDFIALMNRASEARRAFSGNTVQTCAIVNARCGNCGETCAFCAQSSIAKTKIKTYPLISAEEIFKAAEAADKEAVARFGIVTSGRSVQPGEELDNICNAIRMIRAKLKIVPCASLGVISRETMIILHEAGLERYHHNLETSESHFAEICNSRSYKLQTETVRLAKECGLSVCSGGIFGLGESNLQRLEMLNTLIDLKVDCVPVNFLNPIPGTRLENAKRLTPRECLTIIAVARLLMPSASIRVCGGREINLRDFQSWIFTAGADSMMTGGYLVTSGRSPSEDNKMIADAGLQLTR